MAIEPEFYFLRSTGPRYVGAALVTVDTLIGMTGVIRGNRWMVPGTSPEDTLQQMDADVLALMLPDAVQS